MLASPPMLRPHDSNGRCPLTSLTNANLGSALSFYNGTLDMPKKMIMASFSEDNWNAASSVQINNLINDTVLLLLKMDKPKMCTHLASGFGSRT